MASAENFVLKVYDTEVNARLGGSTGRLAVSSLTSNAGSIVDNPSQAANYGYWTFQRYWYRIEANEAVDEFYIDWDDGEDNSPEKANVSIIKNKKPSFSGVTSHIYTQAKQFFPLIRVKSVEGFLSKWYIPHAAASSSVSTGYDVSGLDDSLNTNKTNSGGANSGVIYESGQNNFSIVSIEGDATARIPVLQPAALPPVGVLKIDRKKVFAGIDNTWIGDNSRILYNDSTEYPYTSTIHAVCSNQNRANVSVKVTYQEAIKGGISAVSQISTTAHGTYNSGGTRGYTVTDLEDAVIYIYTMDKCYGCYFTWTNNASPAESANSTPPGMAVTGAIATEVSISTQQSTGGASYLVAEDLGTRLAAVLHGITYHGRSEFTSAASSGHETRYVINSTHDNAGPCPDIVLGSGADVLFEAVDEEVGSPNYFGPRFTTTGVSPSDGTIKQTTINTDVNTDSPPVYGSTARIENVAKVLRCELVNNLEGTDTSHTGNTTLNQLSAGERIYLQANINYATANVNPISTHRVANKNINSTICSVSLGNPIVELEGLGAYLTADATESKIRCSNQSTSHYFFDDNKLVSGANQTFSLSGCTISNATLRVTHTNDTSSQNLRIGDTVVHADIPAGAYVATIISDTTFDLSAAATGSSSSQTIVCNAHLHEDQEKNFNNNVTDKIVDGADFKSTSGVKDLRYTFEWWREFQDANYRFYPQKRLLRCQVASDHTQVTDDSLNLSPVVHFDSSGGDSADNNHHRGGSYIAASAASNDKDGLPSEIAKHNYGALLFTNRAKIRTPEWFNLNTNNRSGRHPIFSMDNSEKHTLLPSNRFDTYITAAHYDPDNVGYSDNTTIVDADVDGPRNAVFMARKEKYDRIFVRVNHDRLVAASLDMEVMSTLVDNTPGDNAESLPKIRLQVLYPAKKTRNSSTIIWKPLKVIDRTRLGNKDDSTFYTSGDISFVPPVDWEKTQHSANIVYPYEDNFFDDWSPLNVTGVDGIDDHWTEDSYALLFIITAIPTAGQAETAKPIFNVMNMYPFNNAHSQLIEIVDPMHVSLNSYGVAQSISFVRKGNFQEIKDRSGISQMRRVGATGGQIKLGGIDLKNDAKTTRAKFHEFQRDAVPVYYDITHKDDSVTRLFGVMTEMSEDHPTGDIIPKFACSMQVTHILELDSSGNIIGDGYKPLGGDVIDVGQYLSAA